MRSKAPPEGDDALNRDILIWRVMTRSKALAYDEERIPFLTGEGFYNLPELVALTTIVRTPADAEAGSRGLPPYPAYYAVETENMRRGIATHLTQPKLVVDVAISDLTAAAVGARGQSTLLLPLRQYAATRFRRRRATLTVRAPWIVAETVQPAQRKLAEFFTHRISAGGAAGGGHPLGAGGRRYYAYLARHHTTTSMTPAQIHALGLKEVARIRREMDAVIAQTGFSGSFAEFLAFLRTIRASTRRRPRTMCAAPPKSPSVSI